MTPRRRLLTALQGGKPDRLPVTTHWVTGYFLQQVAHLEKQALYERFGLDPILYLAPHRPDLAKGQYHDPDQGVVGFLVSRRIVTDDWRLHSEPVAARGLGRSCV